MNVSARMCVLFLSIIFSPLRQQSLESNGKTFWYFFDAANSLNKILDAVANELNFVENHYTIYQRSGNTAFH